MNDHPIQDFMSTAMSSIKEMVDVNTIIGDPISTADGTTIIPVSKVSFGFVTGGSDIPVGNSANQQSKPFGGAVVLV
jgi:sporulation protein YtfJ